MASAITEEQLTSFPPEAQAIIRHLLAEIADLKSQLKQSPRNSSRPPSTVHPHARPKPPTSKSKKKRGGQPGHPKHERALIPSEKCKTSEDFRPSNCRRCGDALSGDDADPLRHQVWELPPIEPEVHEYRLHRLGCPRCGETTCGTLPAGAPTGQSGPRLTAFTGLLLVHFRQSKRRAAAFLNDLLGFPCCAATTVKMQNVVSHALATPYDELQGALATQPQVSMDESPTKQGNVKAWLWAAVTNTFAVFAIFSSRKGEAVPKLLGDNFPGVVNCDRAKMYWQAEHLQWCWAHLQRDFQALIDHPDHQVKRLGHDLMRPTKQMFVEWKRYKQGEISWSTFQTYMRPIREEINNLLQRGVYSGNRRLRGMCKELWKNRDWLWTFTKVQGIEPTNNVAERALRPAVIYRKLSFGTQSAAGSRFVERMLTLCETCRLQKRPLFSYLVSTVDAHFHNQPAPSLLPGA